MTVNSCVPEITKNLHEALQHMRLPDEDRILWIDAVNIDQDNVQERGHQVKQLRDIYKEAERVIIWLGSATHDTDCTMVSVQQFYRRLVTAEVNWTRSERDAWPTRRLVLSQLIYSADPAGRGLDQLLRWPYFQRRWILQEIASARAATIVCGSKAVSARTFALVPSVLQREVPLHCQAVLDIMQGLSRSES